MDIALHYNQGLGSCDIALDGPYIQSDYDLVTALLISVYGNSRASTGDDYPDGDPQGWWGDTYTTFVGDLTGSKLWLLARAKQTDATLLLAKSYVTNAGQWLIDDGVASSIDVQTDWLGQGILGIGITCVKPSGTQTFNFSYVWSQNL